MKLDHWLFSIALLGAIGCDTETATTVAVDNDYPVVADGGDPTTEVVVFKVWWATSLLPDHVAPSAEGQPERTVPSTDFAYAVLAPGWDPSSPTPPTYLIPARSTAKLSVARGDVLHVRVSDDTFVGHCAAGKALSQDDADFITRSIFPGDFAGVTYDAKSCTATPVMMDGGADAATTDAADAGETGSGDAAADAVAE